MLGGVCVDTFGSQIDRGYAELSFAKYENPLKIRFSHFVSSVLDSFYALATANQTQLGHAPGSNLAVKGPGG